MHLRLQNGIRVEEIGGEAIVLDRDGSVGHRVSGDAVRALRLAEQGVDQSDVPAELEAAVESLVEAGIVETAGWSRRRLLLAGGVATAGITTFALASPAAAASVCPNGETITTLPYTAVNGADFVTGPGHPNVVIYAWGGGGGGYDGRDSNNGHRGGGGGGGGAIGFRTVALSTCTKYRVAVTTGAAGPANANRNTKAGNTTITLNSLTATGNGGSNAYRGGGGAGGTSSAGGGVSSFVGGTGGDGQAFTTNTADYAGGGGGGSAGAGGAGGAGGNASGNTAGGAGAAGSGLPALPGFGGGKGGTSTTNGSSASGAGGGGGGGGRRNSNGSTTTGAAGSAGKAAIN